MLNLSKNRYLCEFLVTMEKKMFQYVRRLYGKISKLRISIYVLIK